MSADVSETVEVVLQLFRRRGDSQYGNEAVSQEEHGLQTASLAVRDGADAALITAALLHDIGHLLHDLPADAPDEGIDDRHEVNGGRWLAARFGPSVTEPVRLHVAAKRYLCSVDSAYTATLSTPSLTSLQLQGGPMSSDEATAFELSPHYHAAVQLRRWDDQAKVPSLPTQPLEYFAEHIEAACRQQ